jgi:hypothetical protein
MAILSALLFEFVGAALEEVGLLPAVGLLVAPDEDPEGAPEGAPEVLLPVGSPPGALTDARAENSLALSKGWQLLDAGIRAT